MTKLKLNYFDFPGGRGEDCRLALHVAGVDFEDHRIPGSQWPDHKARMPFGAMPALEVEGMGILGQSNAILPFIGRKHGLHPTDAWQAARHESIMAAVEDLRTSLAPVTQIKGDGAKAARTEFAEGYMQRWGANLEQQIEGPFVGGETLQVADLKLYMLLKWFADGGVDHVPADVFKPFTKLSALNEAVASNAKVAEWNARFAN